jgi:hypothetical protein
MGFKQCKPSKNKKHFQWSELTPNFYAIASGEFNGGWIRTKVGATKPVPMMSASNIHFDTAERARVVNYGGIGAMHLMLQKLGLAEAIDERVQSLKRHLPYHESHHVLNLAYNALLEGVRLGTYWAAAQRRSLPGWIGSATDSGSNDQRRLYAPIRGEFDPGLTGGY